MTNDDIDFPVSKDVGDYYDGTYPPLKENTPRNGTIKRVRLATSNAIRPDCCEFCFLVDFEGDRYDKLEALKIAMAKVEGMFLSDHTFVVSYEPFRRKSEHYARFWVRVCFWKDDGK